MEFMNVDVQNFKRFTSLHLDFKPGINIILGGNGVGKTSALEALSIALSDFFSGIPDIPKRGIEAEHIRFDTHSLGDVSSTREFFSTSITSMIHLERDIAIGEIFRRDNTTGSRTTFRGKGIAQYASRICNDKDSSLPLLRYYSTKRLTPSIYNVKNKDIGNDRVRGYIGCMDDALDIKAIKSWCLDMELESFHSGKPVREYEVFKQIISSFMAKMTGFTPFPTIRYSSIQKDLVYTEDGNVVPINYMSAGYQSLLWMIMDMAFRLAQTNPGIEDFKTITGIVLIDEIDMHLHPVWQWRIVNTLHEIFPKIQFILATHSPIIVSSAKNAHLISLQGDDAQYLPSAYAYSVDEILEARQFSQRIPDELGTLVGIFDRFVNAGKLDDAKNTLSLLISQFGSNNPSVIACQSALELEMLAADL